MYLIMQVIYWLLLFLVFFSYVLFPLIVQLAAYINKKSWSSYSFDEELPNVYVVMAVYNEEKVIESKMQNLLTHNYPKHKVHYLIGSDASNDNTDDIIKRYQKENNRIEFTRFQGRTGKIGIINQLILNKWDVKDLNSNIVFVFTDANVIFKPETIFELVKYMKENKIILVGSNVINHGMRKDGISFQEKAYISRENKIKYYEGKAWGCMMGAFGACYAIRSDYFTPVPSNFLVDDFFICMSALKKGGKLILNKDAICYEDVPNEIDVEFRRKIRISTGNFQNLQKFLSLLWSPIFPVGFTFFSHKVLRWFTPFFLLFSFAISIYLSTQNIFYLILLALQLILFLTPLLDKLLKSINFQIALIRLTNYFIMMNLALFLGFFRYLKGVKSSVWQPTVRNV